MNLNSARRQTTLRRALACTLALCCTLATAQTQPDRSAERAARRAQQQLQGLQQQLQQTEAEKAKLDAERTDIAQKLKAREGAAARAAAAQRAADAKLSAAEAEKQALLAKVADLEKALEEARRNNEATLATRDGEMGVAARRLQEQQAAQATLQGRFGDQVRLVTECSEKNERLTKLGAELIDRYRGKGVWEAARQREPLLGLSDVQMFNQVQEYRDRAEAERFTPSVERR